MCWYCGCHTTIAHTYDRVGAFHTTLMREVDLVADRLGEHDGLAHLHFGGGSPNALSPEHFLALVQRLKTRLAVRPDAEIAVEVDPGLLSAAFVEAMGEAGVTRASLGVQTFDLDVQTRVNRVQPFERVAQSVEQLRAARVGGLNFDIGAVCREHGVAENRLDAALADAAALEAAGLCVREERRLTIPEPARRLMRVVAALFDERLPQAKTRHAPAV